MAARLETYPVPTVKDPYDFTRLKQEAASFGYKEVFGFHEIDTTMRVIKEYALTHEYTGPVAAIADHQTNGQGRTYEDLSRFNRDQKKWEDTQGSSILLSALLRVREDAIAEFSDLIALRVATVLQAMCKDIPIQIKSPNDIVIQGKKIGGILVKHIYTDSNDYKGTNVGIGINIHQTPQQLTLYTTDYGADSLDNATNKTHSRQHIVQAILDGITTVSPDAENMSKSPHLTEDRNKLWKKHSYLLAKDGEKPKRVRVTDIDEITNKTILVAEGIVYDTTIGNGIVIQQDNGTQIQIAIFDTNTKVRVI